MIHYLWQWPVVRARPAQLQARRARLSLRAGSEDRELDCWHHRVSRVSDSDLMDGSDPHLREREVRSRIKPKPRQILAPCGKPHRTRGGNNSETVRISTLATQICPKSRFNSWRGLALIRDRTSDGDGGAAGCDGPVVCRSKRCARPLYVGVAPAAAAAPSAAPSSERAAA